MKIQNSNQYILSVCLILLGLSTAHAEVYKWVDENGRVQYSERKPESAKAQALPLKTAPQAQAPAQPASNTTATSAPSWQEQERRLKQRQAEEAIEKASRPPPAPPRSLSNGREDGTNASRCNLARDIVNGALRHGNGAPLDKNDIDIARNDIRTFCR
ncbi:MAG: hypothetical protein JWL63_2785 [Rhodocyclales bacterium]|nr:hypothetical protein [Rhodocyclales bacterium]